MQLRAQMFVKDLNPMVGGITEASKTLNIRNLWEMWNSAAGSLRLRPQHRSDELWMEFFYHRGPVQRAAPGRREIKGRNFLWVPACTLESSVKEDASKHSIKALHRALQYLRPALSCVLRKEDRKPSGITQFIPALTPTAEPARARLWATATVPSPARIVLIVPWLPLRFIYVFYIFSLGKQKGFFSLYPM